MGLFETIGGSWIGSGGGVEAMSEEKFFSLSLTLGQKFDRFWGPCRFFCGPYRSSKVSGGGEETISEKKIFSLSLTLGQKFDLFIVTLGMFLQIPSTNLSKIWGSRVCVLSLKSICETVRKLSA